MTKRITRLALVLAATSCARDTHGTDSTYRDGQWVWSRADAALLGSARGALSPGIWVATIQPAPHGDSLVPSLALPPDIGGGRPIAAVIRFEPALSRWWTGRSDAAVAEQIGRRLGTLLGLLDRSRTPVAEIQLDFDCPVRLLPAWAAVLHRLRRGALAGREVWITSLVAHQQDPGFGRRLRGAVDGQIVQLFDTGDRAAAIPLDRLQLLVERQGLPFRIGLGAFERHRKDGSTTDHAAWFGALDVFRGWQGYRGVWVFPAGYRYRRLPGPAT